MATRTTEAATERQRAHPPREAVSRSRSRIRCARGCATSGWPSRARWSSAARPATSPSASWPRRSTTRSWAASCRRSSPSSASRAAIWTDEEFRDHLLDGINKYSRNRPAKPAIWESFAGGIEYHRGDFDDPAAYAELAKRLDRIDRDRGTAGNRLFYLAVPPSLYPEIVSQLDRAGLAASGAASPRPGRSAAGRASSSRSRSATTSSRRAP